MGMKILFLQRPISLESISHHLKSKILDVVCNCYTAFELSGTLLLQKKDLNCKEYWVELFFFSFNIIVLCWPNLKKRTFYFNYIPSFSAPAVLILAFHCFL